ncbi:MAG: UDP-N-acetylmuramoylalanine--D-glutamate ligase [Pseudomonadota bacterium]|jgi:UDP-N-acetylmuramoylalanine--D-glutamate ligase
MIDLSAFRGQRFAVMGLARSGLATARALLAGGADVLAWDDGEGGRRAASDAGIPLTDLHRADLTGVTALVLSPGIPHTFPAPNPVAARAKAAGIPIIGDVELLKRAQPDATYLCITGTNGKSTTTALTGHILAAAGKRIQVGGNLGTPVLTFDPLGADGIYVLEMSSYQLELSPSLGFDAAVLLNITPDHLDRHGGMDGYIGAKRLAFRRAASTVDPSPSQASPGPLPLPQGERGSEPMAEPAGQQENAPLPLREREGPARSDSAGWEGEGYAKRPTAIIGIDTAPTRAMADALEAEGTHHVIRISSQTSAGGGVWAVDGDLWDDMPDEFGLPSGAVLSFFDCPALPGRHNWQNACAAYALARSVGIAAETIAAAMRSFPGLAHRQQFVAEAAGIRFVNDSKATNADATDKALGCYRHIYWILGGKPKEGGLDGLEQHMPRIRHAFLIGEATEDFAAWLSRHGVAHSRCGTMETAVPAAFAAARATGLPGAVVLLSPACASFDQYPNFEVRGDHFARLATSLAAAAATTIAASAATPLAAAAEEAP